MQFLFYTGSNKQLSDNYDRSLNSGVFDLGKTRLKQQTAA